MASASHFDTTTTMLSSVLATPTESQTRRRKINCKPELIISALQRFYTTNPDVGKIVPYILGEAPISLRVIDWFVTKFSRKNFTTYEVNGSRFVVYKSYKGQLDAYNKIYFDTNCRRERIKFTIPGYDPLITTIGQLNFFRWALETYLLDYIETNQDTIKLGYNSYLRETTAQQRRIRQEASSSTASSTASTATMASMASTTSVVSAISLATVATASSATSSKGTRRRTKQASSSLKQLQINTTGTIELTFD